MTALLCVWLVGVLVLARSRRVWVVRVVVLVVLVVLLVVWVVVVVLGDHTPVKIAIVVGVSTQHTGGAAPVFVFPRAFHHPGAQPSALQARM